jgi:hypothetical protein
MTKEPRWAVELEGHQFDLPDAQELFQAGTICLAQLKPTNGQQVSALLAEDSDTFDNANDVLNEGSR